MERYGHIGHLVDIVQGGGGPPSHALMRPMIVYLGHFDQELVLVLIFVGGRWDLRVEDLRWI